MFEVQWWAESVKDWAFRASYDSYTLAVLRAQTAAHLSDTMHRVIEQPAGRVVAVFGSSGKRLTFPIVVAIAYAALAKMQAQLAREEYMELARKREELKDENKDLQKSVDELLEDWGNRTC
jgi:uncharacterized protein YlxW (UPF0749 family)